MASRFHRPNVEPPAWMQVLLQRQPECFDASQWRLYLGGVRDQAMGDRTLRKDLERGGMPDFCADCTPERRRAMVRENRCQLEKNNDAT